MSHGSLWLQPV